jgi:O-antigen/teichoic acid export membrane protein
MLRLMPPSEFGRIALFQSLQFIAVPLVSFAADSLICVKRARLSDVAFSNFRRGYVSFAYVMFLVVQTAFLFLFYFGILNDALFLAIPTYGLLRFLISLASIEYVMEGKATQYGMIAFATALVSLVLTALLLELISGVATWRVAALLLADLLLLVVRYWGRMNLIWTFSVDKAVFRDVIRFGFPLLLSVGPGWALNESDKLIVANFSDLKTLGYYAAACTIGGIMVTFNSAMLNSMVPRIYEALGRNSNDMLSIIKLYVWRFLASSAVFGCLFMTAYWFAADFILPERYAAARQIVFVVVIFSLCRSLYAVLGLVTDYYSMTISKLKGVLYGGITAVTVTIAGVQQFGTVGAALGVGVGYFVLSLVLWINLVKKSREDAAFS